MSYVASPYLSKPEILNSIENALSNDDISVKQYETLIHALERDLEIIRLDKGLFVVIVREKS